MITIFVFCLIVAVTVAASPSVTPGCSFYSGQCVYSIQLGQQQQCDSVRRAAPASSSGECSCSDFRTAQQDLDRLFTTVSLLRDSFGSVSQNVSASQAQFLAKQAQLNATQQANLDLMTRLRTKDSLLEQTRQQLANEATAAASEIQRLRTQLSVGRRDITVCQGTLNATGSVTGQPDLGIGKCLSTINS